MFGPRDVPQNFRQLKNYNYLRIECSERWKGQFHSDTEGFSNRTRTSLSFYCSKHLRCNNTSCQRMFLVCQLTQFMGHLCERQSATLPRMHVKQASGKQITGKNSHCFQYLTMIIWTSLARAAESNPMQNLA